VDLEKVVHHWADSRKAVHLDWADSREGCPPGLGGFGEGCPPGLGGFGEVCPGLGGFGGGRLLGLPPFLESFVLFLPAFDVDSFLLPSVPPFLLSLDSPFAPFLLVLSPPPLASSRSLFEMSD
jgi:hypothetical protein